MNIFIEIIGWIGAVLIVGAYSLNIYGVWKTRSMAYILSNLFGGIFFVLNTFVHKAYPSMIVNIIWVLIAVAAFFKKDKKESSH
jgi:uncharacterized protein with PQ loop repeat